MLEMNEEPSQPIAEGHEGLPAGTVSSAPDPVAEAPGTSFSSDPAAGGWWTPAPPAAPASPPPGVPHLWRWLAVSFLIAAIAAGGTGIGVGWGLAKSFRPQTANRSPIQAVTPIAGSSAGQGTRAAVAAKVDPAIVDINTVTGSGQAAGTGMILSSTGEVLTNNHVVDTSTSIEVTIAGRPGTYQATVVGADPAADVALIQIQGVSGLPTVTLASSSSLKVGDTVVALGNALGAGGAPSVTEGTVTALDQSITASEGGSKSEQLVGMIQSDVTISPGDSGGALVNTAGQVVGMITAGEAQGFRSTTSTTAYAVPSDKALGVVNQIRAGDTSSDIIFGNRPLSFIGVRVRDLDQAIAANLGLSISAGALVIGVQPDSPADRAGIAQDAVITKVGDVAVTSSSSLGPALHVHKPGDHVAITWIDQAGSHTVTITLSGVNA